MIGVLRVMIGPALNLLTCCRAAEKERVHVATVLTEALTRMQTGASPGLLRRST